MFSLEKRRRKNPNGIDPRENNGEQSRLFRQEETDKESSYFLSKKKTESNQLILKGGKKKKGDEHKQVNGKKTSRPLGLKWKSSGMKLEQG